MSSQVAAITELPQRFSITIKGQINQLWAANWAEELNAENLALAVQNLGSPLSKQEQKSKIELIGAGLEVEFMLQLSPKFQLRGGAGYLPYRWNTGGSFAAQVWNNTESTLQTDYKFNIKMIPVNATLGYRIIKSATSALDLLAGVGYYLIDVESASLLDRSFTSAFSGARVRNISHVEIPDADGHGWGFHCGIDLEQKISARLALVVGGNINFGPNIRASGDKQENEKLFNDGELISEFSYPVESGNVPPVSHFDLSGLTFHIGLRIFL